MLDRHALRYLGRTLCRTTWVKLSANHHNKWSKILLSTLTQVKLLTNSAHIFFQYTKSYCVACRVILFRTCLYIIISSNNRRYYNKNGPAIFKSSFRLSLYLHWKCRYYLVTCLMNYSVYHDQYIIYLMHSSIRRFH